MARQPLAVACSGFSDPMHQRRAMEAVKRRNQQRVRHARLMLSCPGIMRMPDYPLRSSTSKTTMNAGKNGMYYSMHGGCIDLELLIWDQDPARWIPEYKCERRCTNRYPHRFLCACIFTAS
jgi:hypothetical protein